MKIVDRYQMENIDRQAQEQYGIPGIVLMENAGIKVADFIVDRYKDILPLFDIGILVGSGNNGGDGLVVARNLYFRGCSVEIFVIGSREKFKDSPLINLNICEKLGLNIFYVEDEKDFERIKENLYNCYLIVDSIFGTGLKGAVRGIAKTIIKDINNNFTGDIVAIDIPSGLLSTDDEQTGEVLKASATVTMGLPKIKMADYPYKSYLGKLEIAQIGFPKQLLENETIKRELITKEKAKSLLPRRIEYGNKGDFGRVLVIAGSKQYTGAAILAGKSALRTGTGLVFLASVKSVCDVMRSAQSEIINIDLPSDADGFIASSSFEIIEPYLSKTDAIVFGPGIGKSEGVKNLLKSLLENYNGKLIIDADGINIISENIEKYFSASKQADVVITPHIKEFSRFIKKEIAEIINNKPNLLLETSSKYGITIVLKSAVTLICGSGNIYYNTTGNDGMAKGGCGDVLSGLIGGFSTQKESLIESCILSVYIHGFAGDISKKMYTKYFFSPTDLIKNISKAFKLLRK